MTGHCLPSPDRGILAHHRGDPLPPSRTIRRLLQSYIWQDYDLAPRFPKLTDFLDFWAANLDGPLYRVRVAHRAADRAGRVQLRRRRAQAELTEALPAPCRTDSGRDHRHVDAVHGAALREIRLCAWIEGVDVVSAPFAVQRLLCARMTPLGTSAETESRSVIAPVGLPILTRAPLAIPRDRASSGCTNASSSPSCFRILGSLPKLLFISHFDAGESRRSSPPTGRASAEAKGARGRPASMKALPVNSILPDGVR